jgi:hypothetical protein
MPSIRTAAGLRILHVSICIGALMTTAPAGASAKVAIDCPADGPTPMMSLRYDADSLSVTHASGTVALPASIQRDPSGMFSIRASGPMEASMPEPAALDQCLAAKLKEQEATAADTGTLDYVAYLCRLKLSPSGTVQKTKTVFTITALDPDKAMLFIQRRYTVPSAVTGKPIQLDEFPLRNCNVLTRP